MKRIFSIILLSVFSGFLLSSFSIRENPQDPPRGKKTEKHIKMVKIDDNGKKTELDTEIEGNKEFVWQGDTIGGKDLKWISKEDFDMSNMHKNFEMNFEYKIEDDGKGNIFIMKSDKGGEHIIMPPMAPDAPFPPHAPHVMMFRNNKNKNVIDLSDPGIISYDKKLMKNGTEKITIVRKQVDENDEHEMILDGNNGENVFWHSNAPGEKKTFRIIKSGDGSTQIFEDDELLDLKDEKGNSTFVTDDGKVIKIREKKEGKEKLIEVEMEENAEKENK
jgi:acyl-CoA hydrolase